jgi:ABC-2 type transport system ATP-binding protein
MADTPLLEAKGLTKHYGSTIALESVDLQITEGVTGLVGPNGAGKSTAIKLFLGLIAPTEGSVAVLGMPTYEAFEARGRLGYMPEHDCLPPSISATEFLGHMAQVSGLPPHHARIRAADVLRHVGLHEERYRPLSEYSTGMKQRVKFAQALVHDPVLVLMDEATAGLDPAGREEMLDLIRRTSREAGISILLSTHLMGDVHRTCDRLIVLEDGHVVEQGPVSGFTQETSTLVIDVDDAEKLATALSSRGIETSKDGKSLLVELANDELYDAVRDAIVQTEVRLHRLAPRRGGLTDIFRKQNDD